MISERESGRQYGRIVPLVARTYPATIWDDVVLEPARSIRVG